MKKFAILSLFLVVPVTTHASWWNPKDWFDVKSQTANVINVPSPEPVIVEKEVIKEVPVEKIVDRIIEKPVDRIVTKTVTVKIDNPELLEKIKSLTTERDNWKLSFEGKIESEKEATKKMIQLQDQLNNILAEVTSLRTQVAQYKGQVFKLENNPPIPSIPPISDSVQKAIDSLSETEGKVSDYRKEVCGNPTRRAPLTSLDQACKLLGY